MYPPTLHLLSATIVVDKSLLDRDSVSVEGVGVEGFIGTEELMSIESGASEGVASQKSEIPIYGKSRLGKRSDREGRVGEVEKLRWETPHV